MPQESVFLFYHLPSCLCVRNQLFRLSSTACRVDFFFKFTLKVEFLILSSLVFSSIFLTNLMSVLCFLLFCFPVKCPCFWTICQDWGGHFLDYFDLFLFVLPFLRKSDFFIVLKIFPAAPVLSCISSSSHPSCDLIESRHLKFLTCSSFASSVFISCVFSFLSFFYLLLSDLDDDAFP
jgi:hypothetical protein